MIGARLGLKVAIVDPGTVGGQVLNVEKIENFPGFSNGVAGFDLGPMVMEQAEHAGAEFVMDTATGLEASGDMRVVHCERTHLSARSVIIAAGSALKSLGIPGEKELLGRGVSHCASCDAPFYVGKEVAVVGGGDSAVDEAAVLAAQVSRVTIVHRGANFSAQQAAQKRLGTFSNVATLFGTELTEIRGSETVSSVVLKSNGQTRERKLSGVFIFVGLEPNSAWLRDVVELDGAGHINTDLHLQTSVAGVFAAGDIRHASAALLAAAAGDGATAAVGAYRYLKGRT
jgi:thioredoxin reductase (NADPH)